MNLKNCIRLFVVALCLNVTAQKEVCTSSENEVTDLHTIGKCAIEKFKKSNEKEFVQISTRRRVVRKRMSSNILKLKKNLKSSSSQKLSINQVDNIPMFNDCVSVGVENEMNCFNEKIKKHINGNLKYPEEAFKNGIEDKVLTSFTIGKSGEIKDIKIVSAKKYPLFENEAKRLITNLPKLNPAKHNGVTTEVRHKVYINFKAPNKNAKDFYQANDSGLIQDYVRFDQLIDAPVFIGCSDFAESVKQECIKETFVNNVLENLIYPFDAASEGVEGRVWVRFIVDTEGYVKNITASGPENGKLLEDEAKRLITLLPKFLPGKKDNEYVNVEYFLPIDFQLDE
ncbi:energy transducer TonB [Tenacibaculum sp. 190524A05c]|uniref:energy transducer TonB n=1 Tax=Tenacibaculum platacis TaxID=3137852 RepID=UPI0032B17839